MHPRRRRTTVRLVVLIGLLALPASPASGDELPLPAPGAALAQDPSLCQLVGCLPDRLLRSVVPGPVRNDEIVRVAVDGSGSPASVELEQRLVLSGRGDYQVRERGPARSARSLSELDPPVTKFGAVVWQGFSPGRRELAAGLVLDPGLEAPRLPLSITASYRARGQEIPVPLGPDGRVPGAGTVTVVLRNQTAQPAELPTASDAPADALAAPLEALLAVARADPGPRLPSAGSSLPRTLTVSGLAATRGQRQVPLRVTGAIAGRGMTARVSGPGTTGTGSGAAITGTLSGEVTLTVAVDRAGALALDLQVTPVLDARQLAPPAGAASWAAWAASAPSRPARVQALDRLVAAAATGARAASYSPYLGADLPGSGSTVFRFAFAKASELPAVAVAQERRPLGIALTGIALLLLLTNGALIWRQS